MRDLKIITPMYEQMLRFSFLGKEKKPDGTMFYGRAPHVAPVAFLHKLYPPLTDEQIIELGNVAGNKIPRHLADLYRECNGLHYFSDSLSIDGLRIEGAHQPYDIDIPNVYERPKDAEDNIIFFGGYSWNGSLFYTKVNDEKIYWCDRKSTKPLKHWNSIEDFIYQEANRIAALFDSKGIPVDLNKSTLPG
jgi:hypothetical protein